MAVSRRQALTGYLRQAGRLAVALGSAGLLCAFSAQAAPAGDDWSIERDDRQPELIEQRFRKLRSHPFDAKQWRSLERSLGREGLAKKIRAAARRSPADIGLAVLEARSQLASGEARAAALRLAEIRARAGRWRNRVIKLEIDAWLAAGDVRQAINVLESSAQGKREALRRAYDLAERNQFNKDALRLARALNKGDLKDSLRLARAALAVADLEQANRAFADADRGATGSQAAAVKIEWARAKLRSNDAVAAADLIWQAIDSSRNAQEREAMWAALADAHERDVSSSLNLDRLRRWLANPRHAQEGAAWRSLARLEVLEGRDPTASWRHAVAADPRNQEGLRAFLEAVESAGDTDQTAAEIRRLGATKDPQQAPIALEIASRMIANGHRTLGLSIAADVETHSGRSTATLVALLDFYNLNQESDHALAIAKRMAVLRPRDPEARITLGEQLLQRGQVAEALREWAKLPKLIRPSHRGWARHAELLAEHRHPDAILSLQKALAAAPHEPAYLRLRALLEQDSRVPQRALTTWQEILKYATKPEHRLLRDEARTRVVDLMVSGASGKTTRRRREAERNALSAFASEVPAEQIEAGLFLAELYSRQERYEEAVKVQERLLALLPEPERLAALALAQRRAGHGEAAMATLVRLVKVDPKRGSDVLTELADVALDTDDLERALHTATLAAAGGANSSRAIVRLGELYERRGDPTTAARTYKKALELSPGDPLARLRLARLAVAKGDIEGAAKLFREIIETGGPPEITQEAGRGALDLAEASANTIAVVELALLRAQREPSNEEPRELLLDALDRSDAGSLQNWLRSTPSSERRAALSRVLVYSLNRDSIGTRLRAARHLGQLDLPGSAVPLARIGAQLSPPRDAPRPVKHAYAQARAAALFAAGAQRDPAALPIFYQVIGNRGAPTDVRYAAAWAALTSSTDDNALTPFLHNSDDDALNTLVCIAIARRPALAHTTGARAKLDAWFQSPRRHTRSHQRACAMAIAATTPDRDLAGIIRQLGASDPHRSAIAAWRLGQVKVPTETVLAALFRRYLGPKGLGRDAAGAALAHLLGRPKHTAPLPLPQLQKKSWELSLTRWLIQETSPRYDPLRPADLEKWHKPLQAALDSAAKGTRAERQAYREATDRCKNAPPASICLYPLVHGPIDRRIAKTGHRPSSKRSK